MGAVEILFSFWVVGKLHLSQEIVRVCYFWREGCQWGYEEDLGVDYDQ